MVKATSFLAFDLGAESGRAMIGEVGPRSIRLQEIGRFPNRPLRIGRHLHWNLFGLFEHVKGVLSSAAGSGMRVSSLGVDTWGVDFGLLARDGSILGLPHCYRDPRTEGAMEALLERIPRERVYARTGIQLMALNTLFQLFAMVRDRSPLLEVATDLLFIPDLIHYLLTGEKATEFTFATTSQLYNPIERDWDTELFAALGVDRAIMQPVAQPGSVLGPLSEDVRHETGLDAAVVLVATHDTGSAIAAVPSRDRDAAYISSGTWSLVGVEVDRPIINDLTLAHNFTNEGGVFGTYRLLKNVTGLWLLQGCRRAWGLEAADAYAELTAAAAEAQPFVSLVDPDAPAFFDPASMPDAICAFCCATGQAQPATRAAIARTVVDSLAFKYRLVLEQLEQVLGRRLTRVHVIGGGSRNRLLCQLTADASGLPVVAGPAEATATGNVLVQAIAAGVIDGLDSGRALVASSSALEQYRPRDPSLWDRHAERFRSLCR